MKGILYINIWKVIKKIFISTQDSKPKNAIDFVWVAVVSKEVSLID